ncbi:MAG: hypothetical protein KDK45_20435 [Leptospiraceae bacterium]|nr:hypothetical protein [Leptospiraceae bacterium]
MEISTTDPKIKAIEKEEYDTASIAFFNGIKYTVWFIDFLCIAAVILISLDKFNFSRIKSLDKETIEFAKFLIDGAEELIKWIFLSLVGSFIFKGKGGSQFFQSIGGLIEKGTAFYRAKAESKAGISTKKEENIE